VHVGAVKTVRDALTRRTAYFGPVVDVAARLTAMVRGGQIALSHAAHEKLSEPAASAALSTADSNGAQDFRVLRLGRFDIPDAPQGTSDTVRSALILQCTELRPSGQQELRLRGQGHGPREPHLRQSCRQPCLQQ
jgi:hypothetical protein